MKDQLNTLNTYFWNVGNDIADIRLLTEGALALFEGDAEPLHRLGMKNNEEAAASAFDTIGTALYWVRKVIPDALPSRTESGAASLRNTMEESQNQNELHELLERTAKQAIAPQQEEIHRAAHHQRNKTL